MNEKAITEGIAETFSGWLWCREVTTCDLIESGIAKSFDAWLNMHSDELIEAIAKQVARHGTGGGSGV